MKIQERKDVTRGMPCALDKNVKNVMPVPIEDINEGDLLSLLLKSPV